MCHGFRFPGCGIRLTDTFWENCVLTLCCLNQQSMLLVPEPFLSKLRHLVQTFHRFHFFFCFLVSQNKCQKTWKFGTCSVPSFTRSEISISILTSTTYATLRYIILCKFQKECEEESFKMDGLKTECTFSEGWCPAERLLDNF